VDWDQDGKLDILSGCYLSMGVQAGHLQFLRGSAGIDFHAATTVNNENGEPVVNVVAGDSSDIQLKLKNYCTHQHAVDYDDDGDLDLVVGSNMFHFYFHENVAEPNESPVLSSLPVPLSVWFPSSYRHTAPHLADWDNDGDLDLISGSSSGGVFLSENSGTRAKPNYEPFEVLVPLSESSSPVREQRRNDPDFQLGGSTRVWTMDFNSDGWLDLVIGDTSEVMELKKGVTEEEFEEAFAAFSELAKREFDQQVAAASGSAAIEKDDSDSEESTAAHVSPAEVKARMDDCVDRKSTGFVWVVLRNPPQ
jgi:hypothetical protein